MRVYLPIRNGIGNFVMLTPMLLALRELIGNRIDIYFDPTDERLPVFLEILDLWPMLDLADLNRAYELVIVPWGEFSPAQNWKGAKQIHHRDFSWNPWREHEVEYNMKLVRSMGYSGSTPKPFFPVSLYNALTLRPQLKKYRICIHVGSRPELVWKQKRWPVENWVSLIRELITNQDCEIVFVGEKWDAQDVEKIDSQFFRHEHLINLTEKLSITETARVIQECDLMISTDSGPMHIAAAGGTPIVALFGPTNAKKNAPWCDHFRLLQTNRDCSPCHWTDRFQNCPHGTNLCMSDLTVDRVLEETVGLLKAASNLKPGLENDKTV